jgi:predicted kinase
MENTRIISDARLLIRELGQLPEAEARPAFIIVSGLPGTGKSHFCRSLAERLPFLVLESDVLRKLLFPLPTYSPSESACLFRAIHRLIEDLLKKGIPLILDATNLSERHREHLYHIAESSGVKLVLVNVVAPPELVRQRLEARAERQNSEDKSDADWSVYLNLKPTVQQIRRQHYTVDTSKNITTALDSIVREVNRGKGIKIKDGY